MLYRSLHHFSDVFLSRQLLIGKKEYGSKFIAAVGIIASDIHKKNTVFSSMQLVHDLKMVQKCDVKEVVIYRLGGLTKEYIQALNRFR